MPSLPSLPSRLPKPAQASHRRTALTLLLLLLGGCVSLAPPYSAPELPVAAAFPTAETPAAAPLPVIDGWRDYFSDPQLQALISLALAHNRDLRSAVLRIEEARSLYGIQRAERFPTLGLQAGLDRSRTPADLSPTGKMLIGSQYQVGLGMSTWELDFWGRVRSLQEAALENYLATDAARRAVTLGLVGQVANSYLTLREFDERSALARQTIASRQESYRIFSRRVEVGATSRLELTQVHTLLTQAQALGAQLEQARAQQFNALTLLVGTPIVLPPQRGLLDERHALPELRPGLPSEVLIRRPDMVAAEHQLKAANANIGAARAAFFPRIALTSSIGTASAELDGLFSATSLAWVFSPSISLPIFDGGRRRNNLSLAEARRDLAVVNYEKTVQLAFRDVADALAARSGLRQQLVIAKAALAIQAERARLAKLRYDNGAAAYLDVLDAQRDLLAAEQSLVSIRRTLLSSQISLYAALGGSQSDFSGGPGSSTSSTSLPRPAMKAMTTP